ncbi:DUF6387 family protein, partial [Pseudomonas viridiflava]|uniref:DUF6387 family protein n=1 Tax=Pseudomonas viridiflava TaxID=33069 RepID=UPI00197F8776
MVNLAASDTEIKQAFAAWLTETRIHHPIKGRREKPTNWVRYGLLPYLDLLIWEMETGTDIPDRVMAAAIS